MTKRIQSAVIYRGPSMLDGAPIVVIACKLSLSGKANRKTGEMVQTYILREDIHPTVAIRSGEDASICGDCVHRGEGFEGRTCYVSMNGVGSVFRAFIRGSNSEITPEECGRTASGRMVRLGTYGDPAAAPAWVWQGLLSEAEGWTGYTHQWRLPEAEALKGLCMASADCPEDAELAHSMGWRTFRVAAPDATSVGRETVCPASEEAGRKLQCVDCKACSGSTGRRGSIRIAAHGYLISEKNLAALQNRIAVRLVA